MTSYKAAIGRTKLSAPGNYLNEQGLLVGRILDYGCGRGDLRKFLGDHIEQWDPHYFPTPRPKGKFDTVVLIYVLNVLSTPKRRQAIRAAQNYVRYGGNLFVAVRRDIKQEGKTSRGTSQFNVRMRLRSVVHKPSSFEIYQWTRAAAGT